MYIYPLNSVLALPCIYISSYVTFPFIILNQVSGIMWVTPFIYKKVT